MKKLEMGEYTFIFLETPNEYHTFVGKHAGLTKQESRNWFNPGIPKRSDMFTSDPDYLIINGLLMPFTEQKSGHEWYIMASEEINNEYNYRLYIAESLSNSDKWELTDDQTWQGARLFIGMAYRGGKGYSYTISKRKA